MLNLVFDEHSEPFFVVQGGTDLPDWSASNGGSHSAVPIEIHAFGNGCSIVSPGTEVTFYFGSSPDHVMLDDRRVHPTAHGPGWQRFFVPEGTHRLSFTEMRINARPPEIETSEIRRSEAT